MSNTWDVVQPLVKKWADIEIPESIGNQCLRAFAEANQMLISLDGWNVHEGNLQPVTMDSNQRGESVGKAAAYSARASLSVGLEYGSRDKRSPRTDDFAAAQAKLAHDELGAAGEPLWSLGVMYVGLLVKSHSIVDDDTEDVIAEFRGKWLRGLTDCFRIGLEYSANL